MQNNLVSYNWKWPEEKRIICLDDVRGFAYWKTQTNTYLPIVNIKWFKFRVSCYTIHII